MIAAVLFALPPVCLIAAALFVVHAARRVDATDGGYGEVQQAPRKSVD